MTTRNAAHRPTSKSGSRKTEKTDKKIRWTISGISKTTRTAVRDAAERNDCTIGEWVDNALSKAAVDSKATSSHTAIDSTEVLRAMRGISRKLDRLQAEIASDSNGRTGILADMSGHLEDLRSRTNAAIDRVQTTTESVVDTVARQSDAALHQSKTLANRTMERLKETADDALGSARRLREQMTSTRPAQPSDSKKAGKSA